MLGDDGLSGVASRPCARYQANTVRDVRPWRGLFTGVVGSRTVHGTKTLEMYSTFVAKFRSVYSCGQYTYMNRLCLFSDLPDEAPATAKRGDEKKVFSAFSMSKMSVFGVSDD